MAEFTVEIVEHIGVIGRKDNGRTKEVNVCKWGDHSPKVDIREWDADHIRPSRGLTLTEAEAKALYEILKGRYE